MKSSLVLLGAAAALAGCPERASTAPTPPPAERPARDAAAASPTDDQALYALGALLGRNIADLHLSAAEVEQVKAGVADAALGAPLKVDLAVAGPRAEQLGMLRRGAAILASATARKRADQPFVEAAAAEPGARRLEGGVVVRTLVPGAGDSPRPGDRLRVAYEGTLADGAPFDSSEKRGGEVPIVLNSVIPCWKTGLQAMKVGETARLVCPSSTAYGDRGNGSAVPGGAAVAFTLRVIELNPPLPPPSPPKHGPAPRPEPSEERPSDAPGGARPEPN